MNGQKLYESGLIGAPKLEQAMAWLVENGPLHDGPNLPNWMLKALLNGGRVARLRPGVSLAPPPQTPTHTPPAHATEPELTRPPSL